MVINMQRYFAVDKDLNISDKDKHHIINVMRMKINDRIEIVYDEKVYLCEIKDISKKGYITEATLNRIWTISLII